MYRVAPVCCVVWRRDLDFINILSYDYHVASEPQVNHHAPLRARSNFDDVFDPNEELNIVSQSSSLILLLSTTTLTDSLRLNLFHLIFT